MSSVTHSTVSRSSTACFLLCLTLTVYFFNLSALSAQRFPASSSKATFTAKLINLEMTANEEFQYTTTLRNNTAQTRIYELRTELPAGWMNVLRARGSQITSINIEGNKEQDISIEVRPAHNVQPGKYKIPVRAIADTDTMQLDLEAVIRGSYEMEFTTSTGLLSDHVTEGSQKEIHLVVNNAGSLPLKSISLSAQTPVKWNASFNPSTLEELAPGKSMNVVATVVVPDKTLAGDYVITFKAQEVHDNADATFRISVRTSVLSGWIGTVIILVAIGIVFYLIRAYGRR